MTAPIESQFLVSRWDAGHAATLSEPEVLLYRSNLLGSDQRITNYGGGNTSAKLDGTDPLTGDTAEILWVKGSGGDLGSMKLDGFATLYLDRLRGLKRLYRGPEHEDEMVAYLPHCTFDLNPRAASIDTPLHGFLPHRHVDHVHPDAVIAIAAARNSREFTLEIYGDTVGWLPWRRPGFELGLMLERFAEKHPQAVGVILESHGLFTWGADAEICYENTIATINLAIAWLAETARGKPVFGGAFPASPNPEGRRAAALRLMPEIRGLISGDQKKIGHFDDSPAVLEFVNSNRLKELAALGTSCPDHFLRTKIRPLVIHRDGLDAAQLIADYRAEYAAYYQRCRHPDSPPMRDPNPVVFLVPGTGMITFARDKATARIAGEFYRNAINVMRGAATVDAYVGLPEQEAFDIEYWLLEEAKLQRMPKPRSLAGRIALVTGGAGGIGSAIARRYLAEGASVMLADIDGAALDAAVAELGRSHGMENVHGALMDVTDEAAVARALRRDHACLRRPRHSRLQRRNCLLRPDRGHHAGRLGPQHGHPGEGLLPRFPRGVPPVETTEGRRFDRLHRIQERPCGIAQRRRLLHRQGGRDSPRPRARARRRAGRIRVNVVNPDAVLRGSKIWTGEWREQRAAAYHLKPDELEEHYRQRSLLKLDVLPEDVAEAAYFLASDMAAKSTGNIINVDAGNAVSFTR